MQFTSNMSVDERIAYLSGQTQLAEVLADAGGLEAATGAAMDAQAYLTDLEAQLPGEDALQDVLGDLRGIALRIRGGNRQILMGAIEAIENWRYEQNKATDEARDLLRKASDALDAA